MNKCNLSIKEISVAVERSLQERAWTVIDCCNAYNAQAAIKDKKAIQKDFVHRVKRSNFSVISPRVLELCDFLGINAQKKSYSYRLQEEIDAVELLVKKNPKIEKKVKSLLRNIVDIAGE